MSDHKRRSSKRKKHKSKSNFGKSSAESGKSSFLAMVAGMTTTLMFSMWIVSAFFSETSGGESRTPVPQESSSRLPKSKFDLFLKTATPEQLIERLTEQRNEIKRAASATERAYLLNRQILVAERVTQSDASRDYKSFSTRTLLRNRKSLYGLHALGSIPSQTSSDSFKSCFEQYLNDTDPEIFREAHICKLTYVLFEVIGGRFESVVFTQALTETLDKFPNDEVVLGSVRKQFDACIENNIETAKRLGESLSRSAPSKDHPATDLYLYFLDRLYLIKANYADLFVNRYANGKVGQRELEKQSIELLEHDDCGQVVLSDVNKVANWFEGQRNREPARKIYQSMIESGARRSDEKVGKMMEAFGNKGLERCEQIGQRLSLAGVEHVGTPIDQQLFNNRVVMVLFYAPSNDPISTNYLKLFNKVNGGFSKNSAPIKAIAVSTQPIGEEEVAKIKRIETSIVLCNWNGAEPPALLERFPVTQVPYLLMLNHQGVVSSANVPPDKFEQEAGLLLDKR